MSAWAASLAPDRDACLAEIGIDGDMTLPVSDLTETLNCPRAVTDRYSFGEHRCL